METTHVFTLLFVLVVVFLSYLFIGDIYYLFERTVIVVAISAAGIYFFYLMIKERLIEIVDHCKYRENKFLSDDNEIKDLPPMYYTGTEGHFPSMNDYVSVEKSSETD